MMNSTTQPQDLDGQLDQAVAESSDTNHSPPTDNAKDVSPPPNPMDHVELDEESALRNLTADVRDQDDLERDITLQASRALIEAENDRDQKRIEKAELSRSRLQTQKKTQQQKLRTGHAPAARLRIQAEIARIDSEIELCDKDIADFRARIEQRSREDTTDGLPTASGKKLPTETQREYLIRTGKITPFAKIGGPRPDGVEGDLADAIINAEDEAVAEEIEGREAEGPRSHQNLRLPGFAEDAAYSSSTVENDFSLRPRKRRRVSPKTDGDSEDEFVPEESASEVASLASDDVDMTDMTPKTKRKRAVKGAEDKVDISGIDDGNEAVYKSRLEDWVRRRSRARRIYYEKSGQTLDPATEALDEWFKPSPDQPDHEFENGLKLPGDIYPSLFDYQKTGVQWLAELYGQQVGGIVGDEMGLGKTG